MIASLQVGSFGYLPAWVVTFRLSAIAGRVCHLELGLFEDIY